MKYTGPVYRPPFESNSLLLQVTVGCSHNACTFCTMYRDTPFQMERMEQIEHDLREARQMYPAVRRIFLVNADPFVLAAAKLKEIASKINEILPEVETIAMYASVKNIMDKTDADLRELRALKINELNIGVESGLEEVLQHLNKGVSLMETRMQLLRLKQAGIDFSVNIILGAAGAEKSLKNAIANSALINATEPYLIFVATMHVDPGSPLFDEVEAGEFVENTLGENIREEIEFLRRLNSQDSYFFGMHTSNVIPVQGFISEEKEAMLTELAAGMRAIDENYLNSRPEKGYEGRAILRR